MSKHRRKVERMKTLVIIVLSVSAVIMLLQVQPFFSTEGNPLDIIRNIISNIRNDSYSEINEMDNITDGANIPLRMAYVSSGGRCVLQYSMEELESNYASIATLLGEAIGSANQLSVTDESEWREKLLEPGVYLDYIGAIPIGVLAEWVGASSPDEFPQINVRRLLLIKQGESADLYFKDEGSGIYYTCHTEVRFNDVEQALDSTMTPNDGMFAFEMESGYDNIDSYTLFSGTWPEISSFSITSPLQSVEEQERLMTELGFNPDSEARYEESDGTNVIVESNAVLRFTAAGNVQYRGTSESMNLEFNANEDLGAAISWARRLLTTCSGVGEQYAYLVSAQQVGDTITICFNWSIQGVPLSLGGNKYAMSVTITDGVVRTMEMNLRSCMQSDTENTLLPEELAAAAVTNNGELMLYYGEDGIPFWAAN